MHYSCHVVSYHAIQRMDDISRRQDHEPAHLSLNLFNIGATVQDEIFMNTLGMITIFALISKLEFHANLTRSCINRLFLLPLHLYL